MDFESILSYVLMTNEMHSCYHQVYFTVFVCSTCFERI